MKKVFFFMFLYCFSDASYSQSVFSYEPQAKWLVPEIKPFFLGMPLTDFKLAKPNLKEGAYWGEYTDSVHSGDLDAIQYRFEYDSKLLHEIVFEYRSGFALDKMLLKKLGKKNDMREKIKGWSGRLNTNTSIVSWQFKNNYIVQLRIQ
jgi:hypothetical protein